MGTRFLRWAFYLLVAAAMFHFTAALLIEFRVHTIPIWPGYVMDLPFQSAAPIRIGLLLSGLAALLYMIYRIRAR